MQAEEERPAQPKADKTTLDLLGDTFASASKKETLNTEKKDAAKSTRKPVKKAKTESLAEDAAKADGIEVEKDDAEDKKKAKYNLRDQAEESDA